MTAIVNRFAGTCKTCSAGVGAREGVARKVNGKGWDLFCVAHAGETHGARNPWKGQHKTAAIDYCETSHEVSHELALVDHEYGNSDDMSEPCECGGIMWYKATVGAPICPDCRRMAVYTWTGVGVEFTRKIVQLD